MTKNVCRQIAWRNISLAGKSCERCGSVSNLQRHHPNHNEPLSVVILCRGCHRREEKELTIAPTVYPSAVAGAHILVGKTIHIFVKRTGINYQAVIMDARSNYGKTQIRVKCPHARWFEPTASELATASTQENPE